MKRGLRRASTLVLALITGFVAGSLPWVLLDAVGWSPQRVWGLAFVILGYALFGFTVATVYTYLNEAGAVLRRVLFPRARTTHN
jgi:hypothetical protein